MKKIIGLLLLSTCMLSAQQTALKTPYEKGNGNQSATYEETLAFYSSLDKSFETVSVKDMGVTDNGEQLKIVMFNPDKNFDFRQFGSSNKAILLINNGIHPGETDGIDATMLFMRDLATGKISAPKNVIVIAIPVYNIGGALNRNTTSRVNQNGPKSYGFRGNSRNFDLNRDFVKSDTRNSRSFQVIFNVISPDIFIDNHVSNGADYQYTLTYIDTHYQKLGGNLGTFFNTEMMPAILSDLKAKKIESVPYVNIYNATPENGYAKSMDTPRFSTGYASMFNTLGVMVETHMLKKYSERVKVTYEFMASTLKYAEANAAQIKKLRQENNKEYYPHNRYTVQWEIDSAKVKSIPFMGYEGKYKPSEVSGKPRLYYDRTKPFKKNIPFYEVYKSKKEIIIPESYIIPQQYWNVLDIMKLNRIEMIQLKKDTLIEVDSYKIADFKTVTQPFENHYYHYNTSVTTTREKVQFFKGDYVVKTNQKNAKYLFETLEPEAADSFFNWNFFDSILQQKEYYSPYVFEDLAKQILDENPKLKTELEKKRQEDKKFAESGEAQLEWVYKNSKYFEKSYRQYPIYKKMRY